MPKLKHYFSHAGIVKFGNRAVVDHISLDIKKGEIFGSDIK